MTHNPKRLKILVVDDESEFLPIIQQILEGMGHQVACVTHGAAALRRLAGEQFDLIIADVLMPHFDGIELVIELRRIQAAVRILAISAGGRYFQSADCLKTVFTLGANAVLAKPFTRDQLVSAIAAAMAGR
jgi:CheY-like chemotaxis protein